MFYQDDPPVLSGEISTPENMWRWEYLHRTIPWMQVDKYSDVKLLIGANVLKDFESQVVISSQADDKTRQG